MGSNASPCGSSLAFPLLSKRTPNVLYPLQITLRTITDVSQAVAWLRSTYFYVRVKVRGRGQDKEAVAAVQSPGCCWCCAPGELRILARWLPAAAARPRAL